MSGETKESIMENNLLAEGVKNDAKNLNTVLWIGASLALIVVLTKFTNGKLFKFLGMSVDLSYTWVVFSIITLAHLYCTIHFIRAVEKLRMETEYSIYK